MDEKATLIFHSKFTSGNPNKEKELHCLKPELYSLAFSLRDRFYTTAGRESLLSPHLREWECLAPSDCPSVKEYSSSTHSSRPCFAQGWRNSTLRQARTVLSERCCLWPSQWRTDEPLLLANRLIGPLKNKRMRAWVSLSLSNNDHNVEFWIPCCIFSSSYRCTWKTCCYNLEVSFLEWCCWRSEQTWMVNSGMEERRKDFCSPPSLNFCLI